MIRFPVYVLGNSKLTLQCCGGYLQLMGGQMSPGYIIYGQPGQMSTHTYGTRTSVCPDIWPRTNVGASTIVVGIHIYVIVLFFAHIIVNYVTQYKVCCKVR